jgi:hypothetical protein
MYKLLPGGDYYPGTRTTRAQAQAPKVHQDAKEPRIFTIACLRANAKELHMLLWRFYVTFDDPQEVRQAGRRRLLQRRALLV